MNGLVEKRIHAALNVLHIHLTLLHYCCPSY